jgi:hypothetical protein
MCNGSAGASHDFTIADGVSDAAGEGDGLCAATIVARLTNRKGEVSCASRIIFTVSIRV